MAISYRRVEFKGRLTIFDEGLKASVKAALDEVVQVACCFAIFPLVEQLRFAGANVCELANRPGPEAIDL